MKGELPRRSDIRLKTGACMWVTLQCSSEDLVLDNAGVSIFKDMSDLEAFPAM